MTQQEAKQLIDKYLQGNATPEERKLVESWYDQRSAENPLSDSDDFEHLSEELWQRTLAAAKLQPQKKKSYKLWPAAAVAASISIFMLAGIHYFAGRRQNSSTQANHYTAKTHEILPGGNKAVLILANGKQLSLTDEKRGQIAKEHDATISKTAAGQIKYVAATGDQQAALNTLVTPRGGQYTVELADGTKVTLNAASSLVYPTRFNGADRVVELKGEGYFEVAHDPLKPFRVKCNGQTIQVLGTHFDVNSYSNEPYIKTTLLQGSIKLITGKGDAILKPGQQSQFDMNGKGELLLVNVDTTASVAWKNGLFQFNSSSIEEVMREAVRWYNVDVTYTGKSPDIRISGSMSRKVNFSGLVKLLEFEGVKFNVKNHQVTVINQ